MPVTLVLLDAEGKNSYQILTMGKVVELGHGEAGVLIKKGISLNQETEYRWQAEKVSFPITLAFAKAWSTSIAQQHRQNPVTLPHANANQLKPLSQCLWSSFV